jgi:hypothetical protein
LLFGSKKPMPCHQNSGKRLVVVPLHMWNHIDIKPALMWGLICHRCDNFGFYWSRLESGKPKPLVYPSLLFKDISYLFDSSFTVC